MNAAPPATPRGHGLWPCGAVVVAGWAGIVAVDPIREHPVAFVVLYGLVFAAYGLACRRVLRDEASGLLPVLVIGLACRLVALTGSPGDDMSRYLWEGRVQLHGANPYVLAPDDPALAELAAAAPEHAAVNHPSWTAIYPPLMLLWHRTMVAVAPNALVMKLSFVVAEALLVGLLLVALRRRGLRRDRILVYLWCPLTVLAVALEGHHDVVAAAALLGAVLCHEQGRAVAATLLLGAAVLCKGFAVAALPALAFLPSLGPGGRPGLAVRPVAWLAPLILGAACLVPFADGGWAMLDSLRRFGGDLHYNDSLHDMLSSWAGPGHSRTLASLLWLGLAAWVTWRGRVDVSWRAAVLIAGLLLVLPTVHPWYLMALLPFLCLHPWSGWLALTGTVALTWLPHLEIAVTGEWVEWRWLKLPEYAPLFVWLAWVGLRRRHVPSGPSDR